MKNVFSIGLSLLLLTACTDSPSVDELLNNKNLMSEIQRAAQKEHGTSGVIPIAIYVGDLIGKNLISQSAANEIRAITNCPNLSGIELAFEQGRVTHVDVITAKCVEE